MIRRLIFIVLALLLFVSTVEAKPRKRILLHVAGLVAAVVIDVETAQSCQHRFPTTCNEINPALGHHPGRGRMYLLLGGGDAVIAGFSSWLLRKDKGRFFWQAPFIALEAEHAAGTVLNLHTISVLQHRRQAILFHYPREAKP